MNSIALDPEFAAAVAAQDSYEADWIAGDPVALRAGYAAARAALLPDVAPGCDIAPFETPRGVSGLLFRPHGTNAPAQSDQAIVYFHGGSWLVGGPDTHQVPCSHLAVMSGLPVLSVRYRLAPEHRFPAQREDGVAAAMAALEGGVEGLPTPQQIFLAGDSAGAAVAFWTEAALPPALRARLDGVLGFYGAFGHLPEGEAGEPGSGLSSAELLAAYERLGPLKELFATPGFDIAAAIAADGPPCYLAVGDADPLLIDSEALAAQLKRLGRPCVLDIAPGLGHSYLHFVGRVPAAKAALARAVTWLRGMAASAG